MKKIAVLILAAVIFTCVFCSCGQLPFSETNETNKTDKTETLTEEDKSIIKQTMSDELLILEINNDTLDICFNTLALYRSTGLYSDAQIQEQYNKCSGQYKEVLKQAEKVINYYNDYPDLFTDIKTAIDELTVFYNSQGNSFDEQLMRDNSKIISSWNTQYSDDFKKLTSGN